MSSHNGKAPPDEAADRVDRLKPGGGITTEASEFLCRRTEAFQRATASGPGKSDTYGTGKPRPEKAKKAAKKDPA